MPRWVEHGSDDEAASTSEDEEQQHQQSSPQQAAKRKAAAPEAGPSSNKKVKLSISLSRAKQECHVRHLVSNAVSAHVEVWVPTLPTLSLVGMWTERALCWLCRLSLPRLSQQALLLMQTAWAHYNDLSVQDCSRTWLHTSCLNFRGYSA